MADYAIQATNVAKTYGKSDSKVEALKGINLNIEKGDFFGLIGPNGAGKSTFINILSGMVQKTSGKILIDGHDIDEENILAKRSLGVVPQELAFDPFLTVKAAVDLHAGYYGVPKKERQTVETIESVGLADKINALPRAMSGGMQRRLLIAKAIVHQPPIIILDEPTAGVDLESRYKLWEHIQKLNQDGRTILLTSHYMEEIKQLCKSIAIIDHGNIVIQGPTKDIIKKFRQREIMVEAADTIPENIQIEGMQHVRISDNRISVSVGDHSVVEVIAVCQKAGITVKEVETKEKNIDEIVLSILHQSKNKQTS